MKLKSITLLSIFESGLRRELSDPARYYWSNATDTTVKVAMAFEIIHVLEYQHFTQKVFRCIEDAVLFSSPAALIISQFIYYNYDKGFLMANDTLLGSY